MADDTDALFGDIVERDLFVELVADGITPLNAGLEVGWTPRRTKRNMADPAFAEIVEAARARADGTIEKTLFEVAKKGNLGAIQMWLYNRRPNDWKDVKRIEVQSQSTVTIGVVGATKQAVLELMSEHGAQALQPGGALDAPILDGEVIEDDGEPAA